MTDLADLPAVELARLFAAGDARPTQALEAVLARAEAWEPRIAAFAQLLEPAARASASASDVRYARRRPLGPLDGVPVTVKENVATAGDPHRLGTAATPPAVSDADAPVFTGFSAMDGISQAAARAFAEAEFLLSPVAPIAAFAADDAGPIGPGPALAHIGFTVPFSMSGHPAISVPWSRTADGRRSASSWSPDATATSSCWRWR